MSKSNFPWQFSFILKKEALSDVWPVPGLLKETISKNWIFWLKKGEISWLVKVVKTRHQATPKGKTSKKRRTLNLEVYPASN